MTQQGHMRTSVSWTYRYVNAAVAELSSSVAEYREKECFKKKNERNFREENKQQSLTLFKEMLSA